MSLDASFHELTPAILLNGVKKGAISEAEAEKRFQDWLSKKSKDNELLKSKIQKEKDKQDKEKTNRNTRLKKTRKRNKEQEHKKKKETTQRKDKITQEKEK